MPYNHEPLYPSRALEQMKYEIAQEFGVDLGADTTARENGSVGGEMTKRLIALAEARVSRPSHLRNFQ